LIKQKNYLSYPELCKPYKERLAYLSEIEDILITLQVLENSSVQDVSVYIKTESAIIHDGAIEDMKTNENVTDVMGDDENYVSTPAPFYAASAVDTVLSISDFMSRPLQISTGGFALNGSIILPLPVWDLYFLNPAVRAKLRNCSAIRGNLHVRIVLTSTPFHLGKLMVSYQPYPAENDAYTFLVANTTAIGNSIQLLNYMSQSPESIVMDVKENNPAEIVCPFIHPKPMVRLWNDNLAVSDITSFQDIAPLGELMLASIGYFRTVNGNADDVGYEVYAWLEDVCVGPPTGAHVAIRTESKILDERNTGPIERFSSGAVTVSNALSKVPFISTWATASAIGFGALKKVSAIFGWSVPNIVSAPERVKNQAFQSYSNTIGHDTAYKLTLDPKQELSIDPSFMGSSEDCMNIQHIASRNTYLTTFGWAETDSPLAPIFGCLVTPHLYSYSADILHVLAQPTAMVFAAAPFQYWRGDIEITLEFVCSQFHRGKIGVFYEPVVPQMALIQANLDLNKQYVQIIDIQQTQKVTFTVKWNQFRDWADRGEFPFEPVYDADPSQCVLTSPSSYNGMVIIAPITNLTSPDDEPINVNIYVRCPNLMVNRMTRTYMPTVRHQPVVSSMVDSKDGVIVTESKVIDDQSSQVVSNMDLNKSKASTDTICLQYFGERPVSFRSILKRYATVSSSFALTISAVAPNAWYVGAIYPKNNLSSTPLNYMDMFSYLRRGYVGMRGSMRHRIKPMLGSGYAPHELATVWLDAPGDTYPTVQMGVSNISSNAAALAYGLTMDGAERFDLSSNGGIEFEAPLYTNNLFIFAFNPNFLNTYTEANISSVWTQSFGIRIPLNATTATNQSLGFMDDICIGEDFSFFRFQGAAPFSTA